MDFYGQLKNLRKTKGFTIREVAERSGVSAAYISQLENGNRGVPSPEILMKLSEGLHTSYSALMEMAGYLKEEDTNDETAVDRSTARNPLNLRRLIRENALSLDGVLLSEEDKEWIERMLTALFWKERKRTTTKNRE